MGCRDADSGAVSIVSIAGEMADLDHLARLPAPRFVTKEVSSYQRTSVAPDKPGWFDNVDKGNFIRDEVTDGRTESVILDADGPGAVVRIWSANPQGTIRIYIDWSLKPTLAMPMARLFDGSDPLFPPPLAHITARGNNLYYPMPFVQHCKVTVENTQALYYQLDYRIYPEGTRLDSFSVAQARAASSALARAIDGLKEPREVGGGPRRVTLTVGQPVMIPAPSKSGGVIRSLVAAAGGRTPEQLRGTVLVIRFDGEEAVRAPLDVLFGSGPGINPFHTLPLEVERDGTMRSRWPMPFHNYAQLELLSGAPLPIELQVERWHFGSDSLYFHARWHAPDDLPTDTPRDWNLITVEGEGLYVGNTLDAHYYAHSWWGEGDDKIWVDDDKFPSWFGTGVEDYYGYAWCSTRKFSSAYHAQTRADGPITDAVYAADGFGRTSLNRFHVIDPIPFNRRLQFDFEVLDWNLSSQLALDAVAYYYARPGARDNTRAIGVNDLKLP